MARLGIVVKVGKTSKLKFRNANAYRAITIEELERLYKLNPGSIIVVESIKRTEIDSLRNLISKIDGEVGKKKVLFYNNNENDAANILADELAYDIYDNTDELYRAIKRDFGEDVSLQGELEYTEEEKEIANKIEELLKLKADGADSNRVETIKNDILHTYRLGLDSVKRLDKFRYRLKTSGKKISDIQESIITYEEKEKKLNDRVITLEAESEQGKKVEEAYKLLKEEIKLNDTKIKELNTQLEEEKNTRKKIEEEAKKEKDNLNEEIQKLKEGSKGNQSELNALKKELEVAQKSIEEKEKQEQEIKGKLTELKTALAGKESKLRELQGEIETSRKSGADLEKKLGDSTLKEQEQSQEIENLKSEKEKAELELASIREELSNKQSEIESLNENLVKLNSLDEYNKNIIEQMQENMDRLEDEAAENATNSEAMIASLGAEKDQYKAKAEQLEVQVANLQNQGKSYQERIASLNAQVSNIDMQISNATAQTSMELESTKRKLVEWETKFNLVSEQLKSKEIQYNTLVQTSGLDENGASQLVESNRAMTEVNKNLMNQIAMLKGQVEEATKEKMSAQGLANQLKQDNANMRVSMKALSTGIGGVGGTAIPPIEYTGKGMVIPVFGSGSYGITTTAMSLANRLATQSKVLYIDFDMVNPKADGWFKINPMVQGFSELGKKASALGILVERQFQFFLNHINSIIARATDNKGGLLDYIGGFYDKPDMIKLISTDFTSFLNYCGNTYTYLIIDFGRLGSSELNDQIIKTFSNIAYRNVVVTTSDKFDIRSFRIKLEANKIDMSNVAWLVNMCKNTALEPVSKQSISPALYGMLMFTVQMYGTNQDFTREKVNRDKLLQFMDTAIFRNKR